MRAGGRSSRLATRCCITSRRPSSRIAWAGRSAALIHSKKTPGPFSFGRSRSRLTTKRQSASSAGGGGPERALEAEVRLADVVVREEGGPGAAEDDAPVAEHVR